MALQALEFGSCALARAERSARCWPDSRRSGSPRAIWCQHRTGPDIAMLRLALFPVRALFKHLPLPLPTPILLSLAGGPGGLLGASAGPQVEDQRAAPEQPEAQRAQRRPSRPWKLGETGLQGSQ